jgi:hypothetical protein
MSLSSVLGNIGMNEMNDIISDGGSEDGRHRDAIYDFTLGIS